MHRDFQAALEPLGIEPRTSEPRCLETGNKRMFTDLNSSLRALLLAIVCVPLLLIACGKKEATPQAGTDRTKQQAAAPSPTSSTATNALLLPLHFEHHTGDLDEMVKRRNIRALVILNPIGFFYDKGRPRGASMNRWKSSRGLPTRSLRLDPCS